jgi:Tol biopolymer transport system component
VHAALAALTCVAGASDSWAAREPVLRQVDVPHSYYWRELYLPQLTTGPSAADFLPGGRELVYSMAGSLWRQAIGSDEAVELTHAANAYDYQPDVAADGRSVVFTRYDGAAMEIWQLDLATGREQRLTSGGAVNVEPRLSPDGRRLAWVSTRRSGRFDLHIADLGPDGLANLRAFFPERRSTIDRYYYSPWDHAINPSWSADGKRIFFVDNAEAAWGSGDIWSVAVDDPADRRRLLREETSWSARPEVAPDGRRVLYSSYHGRQWHQLWLTTAQGGAPLPLTFGEFDARNARWSPDGTRVAYVSNENGNTELVVLDMVGGKRTLVTAKRRKHRLPQARLTIAIRDGTRSSVPARVTVRAADGRAYAPDSAWMHADDGFDRDVQGFETQYFHCAPPCALDVPAGRVTIAVQRGFAHLPWQSIVEVAAGQSRSLEVELRANALPAPFGGWLSADLHVHGNYGGHYRNSMQTVLRQAAAEDLDVVYNLIVNKEERVPDVERFRPGPDPASGRMGLLMQSQEYHTSFWGHLGILNLSEHLLLPDFSSYRHTALASPWPHNGVIADLAHAQGALVGYVHPFDFAIDPLKEKSLTYQLPADVAHGKVDYLEVVGFSDHRVTAGVWYRLLNLGLRVAPGAGTDAMANYASLRGPVGLTRVFLDTGGERTPEAVRDAIKSGRSFVSNGPLLGLELAGARPGAAVSRQGPGNVPFRAALRSPVPVDHLELVYNGGVVRSFALTGDRRSFDAEGEVPVEASGWLLLRAWNDASHPQVLDLYPYATTAPVWLELPAPRPPAPGDAAYFVDWLTRVIMATEARDDFNDDGERNATLEYLRTARDRYRGMAGEGSEQGR